MGTESEDWVVDEVPPAVLLRLGVREMGEGRGEMGAGREVGEGERLE